MLGAQDRRDALDAVDAVLQGDDAGVGADQRPRLLGGLFGVPQFDREQHDIDRADAFRVVGDVRLGQMQVAVHALDLEAVLACMAARLAPRAMKNTSWPAAAMRAPK